MKLHTIILATLVGGLLCVAATRPVPVHEERHAFSWGDDTTWVPNPGNPTLLSIPQFDTQGGTRTLRAVYVVLSEANIWYGGYESLMVNGTDSGTFAMNFEPEVGHTWPLPSEWGTPGDSWYQAEASIAGVLLNGVKTAPLIEESDTFCEPYDGVTDYGGTSGDRIKQVEIVAGPKTGPSITNATVLAACTGTDDVELRIDYEGHAPMPYTLWTAGEAYLGVTGGEDFLVSGAVVYVWQ